MEKTSVAILYMVDLLYKIEIQIEFLNENHLMQLDEISLKQIQSLLTPLKLDLLKILLDRIELLSCLYVA